MDVVYHTLNGCNRELADLKEIRHLVFILWDYIEVTNAWFYQRG